MTEKQQRFVAEYLIDLNATAAYKRAGYKAQGNAAEVNAHRLLRNAKVAAAIAQARQARSERTQIMADDVLRKINELASSTIAEVFDTSGVFLRLKPVKDISAEAWRTIQSIKTRHTVEGRGDDAVTVEWTEFKMQPKIPALEMLGRHLGLFKEPDFNALIDQYTNDPAERAAIRRFFSVAVAEGGAAGGAGACGAALPGVPDEPGGVRQ